MLIDIRDGLPEEVAALEALQLRASLVAPDHRADLLAHPDAIEIPLGQLRDGGVRVAMADGRVAGFSAILPIRDGVWELDGLFVEPDLMRHGIGRVLVVDASQALTPAKPA